MSNAELIYAIQEFPLKEYLEEHHFENIYGDEWMGACPGCGKEDKLTVNVRRRMWHCWVCQTFETVLVAGVPKRRPVAGAGGVFRLVQWLGELSKFEAAQVILEASRVTLDDLAALPDLSSIEVLDVEPPTRWRAAPLPAGCAPITAHLPYLERRGITQADVRTFGLLWCPTGRYRNRLVFPAWEGGQPVYWQARAMWEEHEHPPGPMKYLKSVNPPKGEDGQTLVSSDVLFNLDQARLYPRVAITEGPIDAIHAGPSAVCTWGTQLSETQIAKLVSAGVRAVDLLWDGPTPREPEGAWPKMVEAGQRLALFADVNLIRIPQGDPGDYPREHLDYFRAHNAVPVGGSLEW